MTLATVFWVAFIVFVAISLISHYKPSVIQPRHGLSLLADPYQTAKG